jgi:hypothetical protein
MMNVSIESSGRKKLCLRVEENCVFTEKFLYIYIYIYIYTFYLKYFSTSYNTKETYYLHIENKAH